MAKLYTRGGDDGTTSLFDGTRVRKDDLRVSAYGAIDELNAHLGVAVNSAESIPRLESGEDQGQTLAQRLRQIQSELFAIGSELATLAEAKKRPGAPATTAGEVSRLEAWIDEAAASVAPLKRFILPGGCRVAADLHVCRTVCRRAERGAVTLAEAAPINAQILTYLNRLGDLLFAWARWANHLAGVADVSWDGGRA